MKIVAWEIINPRTLNNDSQETCGRQGGLSVVQYGELWIERSGFEAWLVIVLFSWATFPRRLHTLLS